MHIVNDAHKLSTALPKKPFAQKQPADARSSYYAVVKRFVDGVGGDVVYVFLSLNMFLYILSFDLHLMPHTECGHMGCHQWCECLECVDMLLYIYICRTISCPLPTIDVIYARRRDLDGPLSNSNRVIEPHIYTSVIDWRARCGSVIQAASGRKHEMWRIVGGNSLFGN